jgi:hypothetical protein
MNLKSLQHQALGIWHGTGPATRALCVIVFVVNLLLSWVPQSISREALISPTSLPQARLPAVVLDGLVVVGAGFTGLLLTAAILMWINQQRLSALWRRDPRRVWEPAAIVLGIVALLHLVVMPGRGAAVVLDTLILGYLGRGLEGQIGKKRFVRLLLLVLTASGLVTALLVWLWMGSYQALLTSHYGLPNGTRALTHALIVAWALPHAHRTLSPLPLTGLHVVWLITALAVFDLLFSGVAEGARALTAIIVARALLEGGWHPRTWSGRLSAVWHELRQGWQRLRARADRGRGPTVH